MSTLKRAIEIAMEAHRGQKDKSGCDYIGHPLRVMAMGTTTEERILGVLHDVVEDSSWTFCMLSNEGFDDNIINALRCLTKKDDSEPYDKFIGRVKGNALATAVKLYDLTDNMDIRRLPYISDKDVKRLKKYLKAYKMLRGEPIYSITACKQEHPNAFKPWTQEEDTELTQLWMQGMNNEELGRHFGRKPSAIAVRMRKLHLG